MGTFLFRVEDRVEISDRGLILTPTPVDLVEFIQTGTNVRLIRPDKSEIVTSVKGISFGRGSDIMLPSSITKEDVPVGTEVWMID